MNYYGRKQCSIRPMENRMKIRSFGLVLFLFSILMSCSGPQEEQGDVYPEDLAGKKVLLRKKQSEQTTLIKEIDQLKKEISVLDPTAKNEKKLVTTSVVEEQDFKKFVEIQGAIKSSDELNVSSESGGRILNLLVNEGDYVKKGTLVAKLDLEILNKQKEELETGYELAKTIFQKRKSLWDKNIGSEIQFLEAKNNKERLEKNLETIDFQITKANVYAPMNGVVERVMLEAGEMASPGMPIVQLINTSSVKAVADIPENYLTSVNRGEWVIVKVPALDKESKARITMVGRTVNPANRTFEVEVSLPNRTGKLKPNLLATMLIEEYAEKNAVVIGVDWVQQDVNGENYVYTVVEKEKKYFPKKIYVELGETYDGNIVITKGLKSGDQLIEEGSRGLAENNELEIAKKENS